MVTRVVVVFMLVPLSALAQWVPTGSLAAVSTIENCGRTGGDVAVVRNGTIYYCQAAVNSLNAQWPEVGRFYFVHEYGHLALRTNNERNADCWAAEQLMRAPNGAAIVAVAIEHFRDRGDEFHPRYGTMVSRAQNIERCAKAVTARTGPDGASNVTQRSQTQDSENTGATPSSETRRTARSPGADAAMNALIDAITDLPPFEGRDGSRVLFSTAYTARIRAECSITVSSRTKWTGAPDLKQPEFRSMTVHVSDVTANALPDGNDWTVTVTTRTERVIDESVAYPPHNSQGERRDVSRGVRQATLLRLAARDDARRVRDLFQTAARECRP